jgi:4-hydroxy-tetrahydrodipicolinate synthase
MTEPRRFQGIYCPNIVPLDAAGAIDEPEFRRYIDWLIERGVHGLYPNGSTGEFTRFTPEERRRIIEISVDQVAGRIPVLAGAAEANVRETLIACETYAKYGATAVAIVSPYYYPLSSEGVYAYFSEIGRNTPIDVTLYNIPMFAAPIELDTAHRLASECQRIVAIKDSSGDLDFMKQMMAAIRPNRPDFCFMTGWDACLLPMLQLGCDGGTNASSGVAPELTRQLFDAATSGRIEEAEALQVRVARVFDAHFSAADFPDGFRMGAALRGFGNGRGRMPRSRSQLTQDEDARKSLARLLREEELI